MHGESDLPTVATVTSTTLLQGLRDPDDQTAWRAYVGRYRPVIVGYGRHVGLGEEDAEDVAQAALLAFTTAYREGRYDRDRGPLRAWLFGIVKNQIANFRRRRARSPSMARQQVETGVIESVEGENGLEAAWEEEWRGAVLRQCFEELRPAFEPRTLQAFEQVALLGRPVEEVCRELGVTPDAVYSGKRRILRRLRALLPLMEELW